MSFLERVLPYFEVLLLLLAGIIAPNVLSSVYFITFIIIGIVWAFHLSKHMGSSAIFSVLNIFLTVYAGLHVFVLYLYQFPFFQYYVDATTLIPRLLGLTAVIKMTHCSSLKLVFNNDLRWPFYVYPFMVFILYWILAVSNRQRYKKYCNGIMSGQNPSPWWVPTSTTKTVKETSPLIHGDGTQQYGSVFNAQQHETNNEIDGESVKAQGTFWSIMTFLMRQSYIAALIIMMTWSILYHSWLTFVLLLWACLTWITPVARWFCMNSSPYLVIYADLLLIVQYIYGMDLRDDEMPIREGSFNFSELGLIHYTYPVLHLGFQTMFSLVFLVTLRQHYHEKISQKKNNTDDMVLTTIMNVIKRTVRNVDVLDNAKTSDDARALMAMLKSVLAKYWILVCCGAFLLVALQNSVSLYQIFYMVIFLIGFIIYQFSVRTWKTILRPLWWFMVVYSILILLTIYIYQFENMPQYLSNATHLSEKWLHDIGLRQQSKASLLVELLIPTTFSIILVIQLHFFHRPLMLKINALLRYRRNKPKKLAINDGHKTKNTLAQSTDLSTVTVSTGATSTGITSASDVDIDEEATGSTLKNLRKHYNSFTVILWRIAEIHSSKIISFVVIMVVLQQVSAINAVFMLLLVLSMPSAFVRRFINYILIAWSSVVVLVLMLYQLQFVKENSLNSNCTAKLNKTTPQAPNGSHFVSNAWWLGFHKSDEVSVDVRGYLFIVLFIVFEKVVKHHQEFYRFQGNIDAPPTGILFKNISRKMADENVSNCVKYLCNHFFSLCGVEINLMVMILCMSTRGDAVSVIHSLWLFLFLLVKRKNAARLWTFYVPYLSVMLFVQYVLILGWPPGLCKGYPWDDFKPDGLVQWLYLTDIEKPQDQNLLLADFFQLLVACCQANVFHMEAAQKSAATLNPNSNSEQYLPSDFMSNKTWLDFIKILILDQFIWVSLTIVYITAQQTTSLFNSGFMVGCFFFLWHGQGLYLRKRRTMKRWWKMFIMYNFFVVVAKCWLQLVSCVFISSIYSETHCYLIQLLNLYCLRSNVYDIPITSDGNCVAQNDTGLMMDSVCFIVALIQYRIFESTYFKYVIREHRRQSMIAYRGAQLVEERLQIRLNESIQRDKRKMQIIKAKVLKLKQRLAQLNPEAQEPLSHYEAIYAGDYYLFEDSETDSETDVTCEDTEDLTLSTTPMQTSEFQQDEDEEPQEKGHESAVQEESTVITDADPDQATDDNEHTDGILCNPLRRRRKSITDSIPNVEVISPSPEVSTESELEESKTESSKSCKEKAQEFFNTMKTFFQDLSSAATKYLNETSSDYRYITLQLTQEKKDRARALSQTTYAIEEHSSKPLKSETYPESIMSTSIITKEDDSDTWSMDDQEHDKASWKKSESCSVQLAVAFYYALLAHTDLVCYTLMIINHMYYACVLSMPLPFFVFLWGMLSIPRPTKRFWVTVITYVELVIVVKYIFQFQFPEDKQLNFNECSYYGPKEAKSPLCPPRIIGIERDQYSSVWDLVLLLGLFFHRFALKAHGLWREKAFSDEEDTAVANNPPTCNDSGDTQNQPKSMANIESPHDSVGTVITTSRSTHQKHSSIFYNVKHFIRRMLDPEVGTGAVDVYAWMFGAQFIVFIIILSSWSAFSSPQESMSNFAKIIEENNVPKTFLYMLLTQFLLILLDRYLYMKKHVFAKLLYLAILVFLFHIFLFVIVPEITKRSFFHNIPAIFMYLFQCIYFGLSAYQVRCGYPTRILGNFLTKNYTVTSGVLFQGIQSIPFLLELRSVLDWVCTKTTLSLSHWLKMEDIYANVFVMKCWRDSEKTWPHPRGMAYWQSSKLLIGGILLTLLILVIWFPLLLMSFINSAYISNRPVEATFTLTVGGYQPLFKVSTQQQFIKELSSHDINLLIRRIKERYKGETGPNWDPNKMEQELQDYRKTGTIVRIKVLSNSSAIWTISPPSRDFLINDLESNSSISLRFKYVFDREPNSTQRTIVQESVSGVTTIPLAPGDTIRKDLAKVLRSPSGDGEIEIKHLFPTFIQIPGSGPVNPVKWIAGGGYIKSKLILRRGSTSNFNATQVEWWDIVQDDPKFSSRKPGYLEIIALNDLVPPLHLSFFANKGIIGLYVGFVWLVGKFVRLFFTSISYRIMFDELPNVNRVLKLCLEIYMVRESKELKLEEDLFAKLLFLYRSPETLIKWTKYKRLKVD